MVSNILNVHLALFREILSPGPSVSLPVSCQSMLRGVRRRGGGAVAERRGGRSILSDSGADSSILFIREERLSEGGVESMQVQLVIGQHSYQQTPNKIQI